jgi:hypothetical protein
MKFRLFAVALIATVCSFTPALHAQEDGYWRASSNTAKSITGDLALGGTKMTLNFVTFSVSQIRLLTKDEMVAVFNPDAPDAAVGHLYKLDIPGDRKFLHKNSLCGSETVRWMATAVMGRNVEIAMFSSEAVPVLTFDAVQNSQTLCGTFTYSR